MLREEISIDAVYVRREGRLEVNDGGSDELLAMSEQ